MCIFGSDINYDHFVRLISTNKFKHTITVNERRSWQISDDHVDQYKILHFDYCFSDCSYTVITNVNIIIDNYIRWMRIYVCSFLGKHATKFKYFDTKCLVCI